MPQVSDVAGQGVISWSAFEDASIIKKQRESTVKSGSLYSPPGMYDLNGYAGDPTLVNKKTNNVDRLHIFATTNGLGAKQRALFPDNDAMAVEALKLEFNPGPILGADLNISNPRATPTGVKGIFFGAVKIILNDRMQPGDRVMISMTDPSKPAKLVAKGREGTSRNTRRPLIYVKYTPTVSSKRFMTHIKSILTDPKKYSQIVLSNKKSAQAWTNLMRFVFTDDIMKLALGLRVLMRRGLIQANPMATELLADNGAQLNPDELALRVAQWMHALPMDSKRREKRDGSANGERVWENTLIEYLNTIYFDGTNRAYEYGFSPAGTNGSTVPTSIARDLVSGRPLNTPEGQLLSMQINSSVRRMTATIAADKDTEKWVVGTLIRGGRSGKNGVLLVSRK